MGKPFSFIGSFILICSIVGGIREFNNSTYANKQFRTKAAEMSEPLSDLYRVSRRDLPEFATVGEGQFVEFTLAELDSKWEIDARREQILSAMDPTESAKIEDFAEALVEELTAAGNVPLKTDGAAKVKSEFEESRKADKRRFAKLIWNYQRDVTSATLRGALEGLWFSSAILTVFSLLYFFLLRHALSFAWKTSMKAVSDISQAVRGKYE